MKNTYLEIELRLVDTNDYVIHEDGSKKEKLLTINSIENPEVFQLLYNQSPTITSDPDAEHWLQEIVINPSIEF